MKTRTPAAVPKMTRKASSFTRSGTSFKAGRLPVNKVATTPANEASMELAALNDKVRILSEKVEALENAYKKLTTPANSTNKEITSLEQAPSVTTAPLENPSADDPQLEITVHHPLVPAPRRGRPKGSKDKVKRTRWCWRSENQTKELDMVKVTSTAKGVSLLQPRVTSRNMNAVEASLSARSWQEKLAMVAIKVEPNDIPDNHIGQPSQYQIPNLRFQQPSP